ncbi:hypothetical protein HMPREF6123_2430 [Oribacterium sinus F0268]|uniref:Uncharacterized protein n=1 Tax=Oribacterium sinus F0268 TaxID=585501 RepID=C2L111_9FIRM|nr:hypothetical protein HMPREF6123_2430 [Oribacterium sinus F0268]
MKILKNKEREPYARNFVHRIPLYFLTIFMIFVQMPKKFFVKLLSIALEDFPFIFYFC